MGRLSINFRELTICVVGALCVGFGSDAFARSCDEINSVDFDGSRNTLYYFQEGMERPVEIEQQLDFDQIDLLSGNEQDFFEKTDREGKKVFSFVTVDGNKEYCLFFSHKLLLGSQTKNLEFGLFLNSHYKLLTARRDDGLIVSNYKTGQSVTLSRSEYESVLDGKVIRPDKTRTLYNDIFFDVILPGGTVFGPKSNFRLLRQLIGIPVSFDDQKHRHVFEFAPFSMYTDGIQRFEKKTYKPRREDAASTYQLTIVRLINPDASGYVLGPAFWVINFDFGQKVQ